MAIGGVDIDANSFLRHSFIPRCRSDSAQFALESSIALPAAAALVQKIGEVQEKILTPDIDIAAKPRGSQPVVQNLIKQFHAQIISGLNGRNSGEAPNVLSWLNNAILALARAICKVAFSIFRTSVPELTIEEILDELKLSQCITPAQYETALQLAQKVDKKPALIHLTALLGFSTTELSSLLSQALATSPERAFSLLLECHLIKRFASIPSLQSLMNKEEIACLSKISFENLQSFEILKEQLRCLQSLSYRSTLQTWIAELPSILGKELAGPMNDACISALQKNDAKAFATALSPYFTDIASTPVSNESLYAKEVLAILSSNFSFNELAIEVRKQKFLSTWTSHFTEVKNDAKALLQSHQGSNQVYDSLTELLELLRNESLRSRYLPSGKSLCETFRSTQMGSLNRTARKIEALAKKMAAELHLSESSSESVKLSKHILHLSCSCGNGHNAMIKALNNSFKSTAALSRYTFTTQTLDVPVQVTRPIDSAYQFLYNLFGCPVDSTAIYNFLLQHDLCSVIDFLRWLTLGELSPTVAEKKQSLIRQAILTNDPDFLNMVYVFDGEDIAKVSEQLGLPLLYVNTDLKEDEWKHLPTSPFFKSTVPALLDRVNRNSHHIPLEKVEEIGLCVGPEFERRLTPEQFEEVRKRYGILPGEKVVFLSNGGTGLQNSIPERIAFEYADASTPIHLIVVCGTNEAFKQYLETTIMPSIPKAAPVRMTVLGFQQREQMADLTQIADVAIGKGGGMSTMEFIKSGTRVIFDETAFRLSWEKFNASVMANTGRASIMTNQDQIIRLVSEALKAGRRTPMRMANAKASERYVSLVDGLLTSANEPAARQGWRERRRSWHKMNKRMAKCAIG